VTIRLRCWSRCRKRSMTDRTKSIRISGVR
jgi:hypothetical protein